MALMDNRIFRLAWVLVLVVCAFTLGYTLKPRPSREAMMKNFNKSFPPMALPPSQRPR